MMNDNKYGRFETGKIYVDAQGRRWRVVGFVTDPAVMLEDPDYDGTQHPSDPRPGFQVWGIGSRLANELKPEGQADADNLRNKARDIIYGIGEGYGQTSAARADIIIALVRSQTLAEAAAVPLRFSESCSDAGFDAALISDEILALDSKPSTVS